METQHLCLLHIATSGKQGTELGSDQEEIVLLNFVVINIKLNTVIATKQYVVMPRSFYDERKHLSEELRENSRLTNKIVKRGVSLRNAIFLFDRFLEKNEENNKFGIRKYLRIVTDGQLPLRQCLHPEAESKGILLPRYYYWYHDLREEFETFYGLSNAPRSMRKIAELLGLKINFNPSLYMQDVEYMVRITHRMIADGHRFEKIEKILVQNQPQPYLTKANVQNNCIVKAHGFSYYHTEKNIMNFFQGLSVEKGGIALMLNCRGQTKGMACIAFANQKQCGMALKRNGHRFGKRYISVVRGTKEEFIQAAGEINNEAILFLAKRAQAILGMKGLPLDCTVQDVLNFFQTGTNSTNVMDGTEGVLLIKKRDGIATGCAFVLFLQQCQARKAFSKNRHFIGSQRVTLYFATHDKVKKSLSRALATTMPTSQEPLVDIPPMPLLDQNFILSGTERNCIRLLGLPKIAEVEHILQFLGVYANSVASFGLHIVYETSGEPRGDAFIRMDSVLNAYLAAQEKNFTPMTIGNQDWIIQVQQCSGEDMRFTLTTRNPTMFLIPPNSCAAPDPYMILPPNPESTMSSDAGGFVQPFPFAMTPTNMAFPYPGEIVPPPYLIPG